MSEKQNKAEARGRRVVKEVEREEQRQRDPNAPFTGALTSKTKADPQDIVQVLALTGAHHRWPDEKYCSANKCSF